MGEEKKLWRWNRRMKRKEKSTKLGYVGYGGMSIYMWRGGTGPWRGKKHEKLPKGNAQPPRLKSFALKPTTPAEPVKFELQESSPVANRTAPLTDILELRRFLACACLHSWITQPNQLTSPMERVAGMDEMGRSLCTGKVLEGILQKMEL